MGAYIGNWYDKKQNISVITRYNAVTGYFKGDKSLKSEKQNRIKDIIAPYILPDDNFAEMDKQAAAEFAGEIDSAKLMEYIGYKRSQEIRFKKDAKGEKKNLYPFADLSCDRLRRMITHSHPYIALEAKLALARKDFFYYCHLKAPDFYNTNRPYIVKLCDELQEFYESDDMAIIISMPPRHGKSRTATLFEQWIFGKNNLAKIITGSYNETVSTTFSKAVRNGISEVKAAPDIIVFSDVFPEVRIQRGEGAMNMWSLEGQYSSYLATSPDGTVTGFGGSLIVIDDIVKHALEAFNENLLEAHWKWFTDTMLSRRESGGKIIIIMTRWASKDLAGRIESYLKREKRPHRVVKMKAVVNEETHEMLCPEVLTYNDYLFAVNAMSEEIAKANYQQEPIDLKGRLYQSFKTYSSIPCDENGRPVFTAIKAYCDTADEGSDYLCNIIYGVHHGYAYILDVYYTKEGMEITEEETARRLRNHNVGVADIESNNGGRGFARSVQRIMREILEFFGCSVNWFHQSENKRARILTSATFVQNNILFPEGWEFMWPEYHEAMFKYQKEGKNAHDDAPDATTGVAEKCNDNSVTISILGENDEDENIPAASQGLKGIIHRVLGRLSDNDTDKWR